MHTKILSEFSIKPIDTVAIQERVSRLQKRSIKNEAKLTGLKLALSMIDLTTLEGKDTPQKVKQLCYKALHLHDDLPDLPTTAAVCVYPNFVGIAKKALMGSDVKVAAVATAFPSGQSNLEVKKIDTQMAIDLGADEVDMVISRGEFLQGNHNFVFDEIATIKSLCNGKARLKVIFETGELVTLNNVALASKIAIAAGADFIKTSTGKIQPAATPEVTLVMLEAIRDHFFATGKMVGMKPAGGISNAKTALQYLVMVKETLGNAWLSNQWFRFGASSLANDVVRQLLKQQSGMYQNKDYISID